MRFRRLFALRVGVTVGLVAVVGLMGFAGSSWASGGKGWWHVSVSSRPSSLTAGAARSEVQEIVDAPSNLVVALEINKVRVENGNSGIFESAPYSLNAFPHLTAKEVQAALETESAYGAGNVVVEGQGPEGLPPLKVRTVNGQADRPVAPLEFVSEPGGSAEVHVVTPGRADGEIALVASNLGERPVEGEAEPVRIADTVPPGLEAVGVEGVEGGVTRTPLQCSVSPVSCTFEGALPPYETIEVRVLVDVKPGASSGEVDTATASGGRVGTVSGSQRLVFGREPVFGVQDYELTPEEEGGGIDTQAGSHPFQLTTTINLNQTGETEPVAAAKDLHFILPPGLSGNPTPLPQCTVGEFLKLVNGNSNECRPETAIGVAAVSFKLDREQVEISRTPLFNLEPEYGEPARFGFYGGTVPVILDTAVRTGGDYGVTVSVNKISQLAGFLSSQVTFWGVPGDPRHDNVRGWACLAEAQQGQTCQGQDQLSPTPLLSLPTSCTGVLQSAVEADSWLRPGGFDSFPLTAPMPALDGCNRLPFSPSISVAPDVESGSSPTGLTVGVHVPQDLALNPTGLAEANVEDTTLTLPEGVALNPGTADGLEACSEVQVALSSGSASSCPDASKVGTVEIASPLLPEPLVGAVYLAAQNANPFGSLVALYIVVEDPKAGVLIKVAGEVKPDPVTGQLVSTFKNTPQLSFEDLKLHFFGGARAPLSNPSLCGGYTTKASIAPWSGNSPSEPSSEFHITTGPNGSPCSNPLPFTPSLTAGTTNIQAGEFTPFTMTVSREDGQQSIKTFQLHMPPGLSGLLAGVKLCGEAEADAGTCGPESLIGETTVSVGEGGSPYSVKGGRVYITGPYEGAPFGVSVVVPAKAGPYDLGTVVVRGTIMVDPITAALTITIDDTGPYKIPTILDGIPLQIRHINFTTTRPGFTFNPTDCDAMSVTGSMSSTEGATAPLSVPFQVTNCAVLGFKPGFKVTTSGKTSRARGASLSVKLTYPKAAFGSQANIRSVKVDLPKQLPSRLTTLQKACTAAQFQANPAGCPAASTVGHATAITPLIPVPLRGPAYFVSYGGAKFPELVVVLQGYGVTLDLHGETFISKAGITSSTFHVIPDAPVGSFELTLSQGPFSALAANGNLCESTMKMPTAFTAQNGATIKQSTPIGVTGCAKKAKKALKAGKRHKGTSHGKK